MISLIAANEIRIDSGRLQSLFHLLNVENQPEINAFLALPETERDFYGLFLETNVVVPSFLVTDWKWEPEDLFRQIKQALPNHNVELLNTADDEVYLAFNITFSINDKSKKLTVHDEEPNVIFETINSNLNDQEFVFVDFQGDEYAWLLVPKATDIQEIADLIGYKVINPITIKQDGFSTREESQAQRFTKHFDVNQPLATLTSFYPVMYHRVDGVLKRLMFMDADLTETDYHFSVEPGQTLHDAMAETLHRDIDYQGSIEMNWVKPADIVTNSADQGEPSYSLQIYLVGDVQPSVTPNGLRVSLDDTPEIY